MVLVALILQGGLSASDSSAGGMAADNTGNLSSNTGSVVGNGIVKLFDSKDVTFRSKW